MVLSKKLAGWMGGWMGGWVSRIKDCLQQSKIVKINFVVHTFSLTI
jgi:hypothetical protein